MKTEQGKESTIMFRIALIIATIAALASPAPAMDRQEVEKIIQEYVKNHPEEIDQSLRSYYQQKRQQQEEAEFQESLRRRFDVPVGGSPVKGPGDAPVTIVEFSDFQCPYCARSIPTLKALEQKYGEKVRLVYKHFPLTGIHPFAIAAARASLAAGEQGKFWEFHDVLLLRQGEWGAQGHDKFFDAYAGKMGLDAKKFAADYGKEEYRKMIDADMELGKKLDVRGTPTFFINGVIVRGVKGTDYFSRVIDYLLAETRTGK